MHRLFYTDKTGGGGGRNSFLMWYAYHGGTFSRKNYRDEPAEQAL